MASLTFTKQGGTYTSQEVTVYADFNLHLERTAAGSCHIKFRTAGTKFSPGTTIMGDKVVDFDVDGLVYPKTVVVVSSSEVTSGIITEA